MDKKQKEKNIFKILLLFLGFFVCFSTTSAQLIFIREAGEYDADKITIDADDSVLDFVDLEFGSALGAKIRYDVLNDSFLFNRDVDLNNNQLLSTRVENLATVPTCDGTVNGKIYHNTADTFSYICDGTIWKQIDSVIDGHTQNTDTGTNSNSFILNTDATGGDVALVFGTTLNERLTWNNTNSRFDLSDALNIFEDLTVGSDTETIDNASFALDGNDVFIADSLGVEGAIYTDDTAIKYQFLDIYGCIRGSASAGAVASGNSPVIRFNAADSSQIRCSFPIPDDWIVGTDIEIETYWSPSNNTTGDIDFDLLYASYKVGDTISPVDFIDTIPGTTYETVLSNTELEIYELVSDISEANIAADEMINFRFRRSPADAGDTYTGDINIHMMRIAYTGKKLR